MGDHGRKKCGMFFYDLLFVVFRTACTFSLSAKIHGSAPHITNKRHSATVLQNDAYSKAVTFAGKGPKVPVVAVFPFHPGKAVIDFFIDLGDKDHLTGPTR